MAKATGPRRVIAHVDMDAFYASVEAHDDPSLQGLPLVVGGPPEKRGVVAAASYEARRFGIRSAMPMARAVVLCPDLVRISPRMARYREVSGVIMGILKSFSPLVEPLSLDEAFVDLTGTGRTFGEPVEAGEQIRAAIRAETGLTASVGIAPNKFLAKLASDENKPDGLTLVTPETAVEFVQRHPVERIWGVGEKTADKLHRLGLHRAADVAAAEPSVLKRHFGLLGLRLHELAWGRDDRPVVPESEPKSVSHEVTFAKNQKSLALLQGVLTGLSEQTARRLRRARMVGRTVNLKLRYGDFTTITRQESLGHPTDDAGEIDAAASRLLEVERALDERPVRLLGVGVTGLLRRTQMNLDLFGAAAESASPEAPEDDGGGEGDGDEDLDGPEAGEPDGDDSGGGGGGASGGGGAPGGGGGGASGGGGGGASGGGGGGASGGGGSGGGGGRAGGGSGEVRGAGGGGAGPRRVTMDGAGGARPEAGLKAGLPADGGEARRRALNLAVDRLTERFGPEAVTRARSLAARGLDETPEEARGRTDGGRGEGES